MHAPRAGCSASARIVLAYDDSDGSADHVSAGILNSSNDTWPTVPAGSEQDQGDSALCSTSTAPKLGGFDGRCGPGMRQPLIVISPYAKVNFVDHTLTTQSSILKFIEDNWSLGRIGDGSFDATAGSLSGLFDFRHPVNYPLIMTDRGAIRPGRSLVTHQALSTIPVGWFIKTRRSMNGALSTHMASGALPVGLKFTVTGPNSFTISGRATGAYNRWISVIFDGPGWKRQVYYTVKSR